jgi:hypothetical protein
VRFFEGREREIMRNDEEKDYSTQDARIIAREERRLERLRDKKDALERNDIKAMVAGLKSSKRALQKDAVNAIQRRESGGSSANEIAVAAAGQACLDSLTDNAPVYIDEGVITGKYEKNAPWLRHDDDDEDDY